MQNERQKGNQPHEFVCQDLTNLSPVPAGARPVTVENLRPAKEPDQFDRNYFGNIHTQLSILSVATSGECLPVGGEQ